MKNIVRLLVAVLVAASIVSVVGCSSGPKDVGSVKDRMASMLKVLPANVSGFSYQDIYTLRTDKNMASEWASMQQQPDDRAVLQRLNGLGMVEAEGIMLLVGDVSIDELIKVASNGSYEYGGFKVKTYTGNVSAALINGVSISSFENEMKRCIDVANGKAPSMYGSGDLQAVLARVPDGYIIVTWIAGNETVPEGFDGLLAVAQAITRQGSADIQTAVYKFNGSDTAQQYVKTVGNASQDDSIHLDITQDGVFVKVVATPVTPTPTPTATVALTPKPTATPVVTVTPTPAP